MDQIETLVDSHASFDGKLTGKNVRVAGSFRGEIHLSGRLHISEGSKVEANVVADAAEIGGELKGQLKVRSVILLEKGRLEGTLEAQSIAVREGAQLNGPVNIGTKEPAWAAGAALQATGALQAAGAAGKAG